MQTTRAVNGYRLSCVSSSPLRAWRATGSGILFASRNRYSCCASSNWSIGSAAVSISNTSVAICVAKKLLKHGGDETPGKRKGGASSPVHCYFKLLLLLG